jgi:hypothetical protein
LSVFRLHNPMENKKREKDLYLVVNNKAKKKLYISYNPHNKAFFSTDLSNGACSFYLENALALLKDLSEEDPNHPFTLECVDIANVKRTNSTKSQIDHYNDLYDVKPCIVCNATTSVRCSRCKETWYCSKEHQISHWKIHKKTCIPKLLIQ